MIERPLYRAGGRRQLPASHGSWCRGEDNGVKEVSGPWPNVLLMRQRPPPARSIAKTKIVLVVPNAACSNFGTPSVVGRPK